MPYDQFGNYTPYPVYPNVAQPGYPQRQTQPQQNVYAFVNGVEGAKSYQINANQTVLLMDSEQQVCYLKQANAMGQATLRYFKLVEVSENDVRNIGNKNVPQNGDFATKKDIEDIIKRLDALEKPKE